MSGPWASVAEDVLPYEVKRLVFNYVDLDTLKQLRLASHSWAAVGTELLLLPTIFIKSYSADIPRLTSIGSSPAVSQHAATTVKSVVFQSHDWDPLMLRKILTSRHEARVIWETADFVPTLEEQAALDELDALIKQRGDDQILRKYSKDSVTRLLGMLPRVNTIKIVCQNLFKSRLLRKVFDEFSLETHRQSEYQTKEILGAAKDAGLNIKHFTHEQFLPDLFHCGLIPQLDYTSWEDMVTMMQQLESLRLTISSVNDDSEFTPDSLIVSLPQLHDVSIKFEVLGPVNLDFLSQSYPPRLFMPHLHTISLYNIYMEPVFFFRFLRAHADTLKRLHISSAEIPLGEGSWSNCLARMKENVGPKLEKFQLSRCKAH